MGAIASQITSLTIVYSIVYSDADQRKHQRSASLAFAPWIQRGPVNSPHKWRVTRKMFPFDDVIMGAKIQIQTDLFEHFHRPRFCYVNTTALVIVSDSSDWVEVTTDYDIPVGIIENKSTLLTISRLWCYCGPSNYRFNFLLYLYAPWVFFWGRQCAFVFPIYLRKYRK